MKKINIILTSVISFLCLVALVVVIIIKNTEEKAKGDGTIIVELLDVDNGQAIYKSQPQSKQVRSNIDPSKMNFVPYIEEEKEEEPVKDTNKEFQNQMNNVKPIEVDKNVIQEQVSNYEETKAQISNLASEIFGEAKKTEATNTTLEKPLVEPVEEKEFEFVVCPGCGSQINSNVKTCFVCGTRISN